MQEQNGFIFKDNILYGYYGNDENIVIPDFINIIYKNVFHLNNTLKTIHLSNVSYICADSFSYCHYLTTVIYNSNELLFIGEKAFYNCYLLYNFIDITNEKNILLDNSSIDEEFELKPINILAEDFIIEEEYIIKESAFEKCISLLYFDYPQNINSIERYAFKDCYSLRTFIFPDIEIKVGPNVFECNKILERVVMPETNKIVLRSKVFSYCESLYEIENMQNIEFERNIDQVFIGCFRLNHLVLYNRLLIIPNNLLHRCDGLRYFCYPKNIHIITNIYYGENLKAILFPENYYKIEDLNIPEIEFILFPDKCPKRYEEKNIECKENMLSYYEENSDFKEYCNKHNYEDSLYEIGLLYIEYKYKN